MLQKFSLIFFKLGGGSAYPRDFRKFWLCHVASSRQILGDRSDDEISYFGGKILKPGSRIYGSASYLRKAEVSWRRHRFTTFVISEN